MRDIVHINAPLRVKSKYRNFNDFMKNAGRDDFSSASSTDSGYSDGAGAPTVDKPAYTSYQKFLDSYGKKEFRSVTPPTAEKKSVKSEMFITVNEPSPEINLVVRVNQTSAGAGVQPAISQKPVLHVSVPSPPAFPPPPNTYRPQQNHNTTSSYKPPINNNQRPPAKNTTNETPTNNNPQKTHHKPDETDNLKFLKNSVIDEIRRNGEGGFPAQKNRAQYVPQNSYQFTKMFAENPTPVTNTLPKSWKSNGNARLSNREADTVTRVPVAEETATINKNDPNIHKMVYGTYRGLLSAYNKPANNFVSTLPRNMVVQDKGVAEQLNSIQLNGCLDQLTGRANPKDEP